MKKIMLLGPIGHGKTTLIQALTHKEITYDKTQDVIYSDNFIDTPGEFVQHRRYNVALQATSQDASLIIFLLNPRIRSQIYAPGYAASFNKPVIGVINHIDLAETEDIDRAINQLRLAGVKKIFKVSPISRVGLDELGKFLEGE
ncbi:EutP/PduV family microcompartment system protein [Streptococcus pluranimalium]|uniref:Propanediol utilization protein PduV n=1 Tax=Streptococcus pluranimalium TaxID=82348 RepID=A0A345VM95_9STRE|nr:EutP/PduV family microcompartment system protein [Streptococcus pluranimalium]AXJ13847.1 Propanediol utilization protein PduV [Streptococcus pluranimalium]